jgi:signal transduction histidine kinase
MPSTQTVITSAAAVNEHQPSGARIVAAVDGERRLPPPVEIAAYYMVSEALTNVAKYACATTAAVNVTRDRGRVVVEVVDDGVGGADAAGGSGLRGLADRVQALRGRVLVLSPPGGGTRVRAEIPCDHSGSGLRGGP